jgi:hypothetical protein
MESRAEAEAEAEAETGGRGGRPDETEVNPTDNSEETGTKRQTVEPPEKVAGATSKSRETSIKRAEENRREATEERERETRQQENGDEIGPGGADGELFARLSEPRIELLKAEGETDEDKGARQGADTDERSGRPGEASEAGEAPEAPGAKSEVTQSKWQTIELPQNVQGTAVMSRWTPPKPLPKFKPRLMAKPGDGGPPAQGNRPSEEKKAEQEQKIGQAEVKSREIRPFPAPSRVEKDDTADEGAKWCGRRCRRLGIILGHGDQHCHHEQRRASFSEAIDSGKQKSRRERK